MTDRRNDPKQYRELSQPFDSSEIANEALKRFFDDVEAARTKHKIADVTVIVEVRHMIDGEEVRGSASSHFGDSRNRLPMIAREYGAERQRHEDEMGLLIAMSRKSAAKPIR